MSTGRTQEGTLRINNNKITKTDIFTNLGSQVSEDGSIIHKINNRTAKFSQNVRALYPLLRDKHIPHQVKTHIYNTILKLILLYARETWTFTTKTNSKLQACEVRVLRLIMGVTGRDCIRNDNIRKTFGVEAIMTSAEENQL